MYINWHGHSCFSFEEKIDGQNIIVVTDPYDGSHVGLRLPKLKADIVTVSHGHQDHNNVGAVSANNAEPIIFDRPGEYEVFGVYVQGIGAYHDNKEGAERGKSTMFLYDIGGVKILHLGDLGTTLSDAQLSRLEDIDVLLVPVGGKYTIDAKVAEEVVRQVEPRIVIPMHYKIDGVKIDIDTIDKFKKEMGSGEVMPKLKINKKDLPQEETKFVILEKT